MPYPAEDYLFFWKPTQKHGWAGQWYKSPFTDHNDDSPPILFPTAEHYMMYHKAILFSDPDVASTILSSTNPAAVKKLGQQVHNFDEQVWKAHRYEIVRRGNFLKFTQNPHLKQLLLDTGDKILVEASPFDKIWGIGKKEADALANKEQWGLNLLGQALMEVREQLRAADAEQVSNEVREETAAVA